MGSGAVISRVKRPGLEAENSSLFSAEVKNGELYLHGHVCMA
jgi:hypothetical protein